MADRIPNIRLDLAPEKRRILFRNVRRAGIPQLLVGADLGKLMEQRVQLAR